MANPQIKHYGKVVNGKLKFINEPLWFQQTSLLEGREFELIIKERHKKPTNDQYGYYFGGVLTTCHSTEMFSHFNKPQDIHDDFFGPMFLSYKTMVVIEKKGSTERYEVTKQKRLSDLNRKDMGEFVDKVIAWCETEGITILSPESYYTENFKTLIQNGE
jgi:hypothetical protein